MRCLALVCAALALFGCDRRSSSTTRPDAGAKPAPRRAPPAPFTPTRAPIRDNGKDSEARDGVLTRARLLVSTLTSKDPVSVVFAFVPAQPKTKGDPWYYERVDWAALLGALRVEIVAPGGKTHSFELAEAPGSAGPREISYLVETITVDGSGLGPLRWKNAVPDLFGKPGKYSIALQGKAKTEKRELTFETAPLAFDVVAADETHKPLAELERIGAESVAKRHALSVVPKPSSPTIDDVDGNRWLRFTRSSPGKGYDVSVSEILLDPSGRELFVDEYEHFTCIAVGTPIATPLGEKPIEALEVGDEVTSYDPERRVRGTTRVHWIERAHAERLHVIGRLRATGEHPIFVDGTFLPAKEVEAGARLLDLGLRAVSAEPRALNEAATVYDLGVGPPHTYFAGGVLVHNKAMHVPLGGSQPFRGYFHRRAAKQK